MHILQTNQWTSVINKPVHAEELPRFVDFIQCALVHRFSREQIMVSTKIQFSKYKLLNLCHFLHETGVVTQCPNRTTQLKSGHWNHDQNSAATLFGKVFNGNYNTITTAVCLHIIAVGDLIFSLHFGWHSNPNLYFKGVALGENNCIFSKFWSTYAILKLPLEISRRNEKNCWTFWSKHIYY